MNIVLNAILCFIVITTDKVEISHMITWDLAIIFLINQSSEPNSCIKDIAH